MNKVVIIDSGLSERFLNENKNKIKKYKDFCKTENKFDIAGHGTAVAGIINRINKNVDLFVFKIFDDSLVQKEQVLILVLKYILESNISDAIIHMSFGINYYNKQIYELLKELPV